MGFYLRCRRLQSGAAAQADRGGRLMAKVPRFAKAFAGRWRIVEMDNWDGDFLDLVEEAHRTFEGKSDGEIAFGALKAFSTSATASETVRPARSSHGKGTMRMTPPAVADRLSSALRAGSSATFRAGTLLDEHVLSSPAQS